MRAARPSLQSRCELTPVSGAVSLVEATDLVPGTLQAFARGSAKAFFPLRSGLVSTDESE